MLQETISKMPEEEAKYHLKRCVDSGLWVPDASKADKEGEAGTADADASAETAAATAAPSASSPSSSSEPKPNISTEDVD